MLPGLETRAQVQHEISRLEIDAMNYDRIGFQYHEPNRYLQMATRIRTVLLPQLRQLLDSEEFADMHETGFVDQA